MQLRRDWVVKRSKSGQGLNLLDRFRKLVINLRQDSLVSVMVITVLQMMVSLS